MDRCHHGQWQNYPQQSGSQWQQSNSMQQGPYGGYPSPQTGASQMGQRGPSTPGPVSFATQGQIKSSLESSGFKNVTVLPQSFLIRATAPDGSRVLMQVSSDSLYWRRREPDRPGRLQRNRRQFQHRQHEQQHRYRKQHWRYERHRRRQQHGRHEQRQHRQQQRTAVPAAAAGAAAPAARQQRSTSRYGPVAPARRQPLSAG